MKNRSIGMAALVLGVLVGSSSVFGADKDFQRDEKSWKALTLTNCKTSTGKNVVKLDLEETKDFFSVSDIMGTTILIAEDPKAPKEESVYWDTYGRSVISEVHPYFLRLVGETGTRREFWFDATIHQLFSRIDEGDKTTSIFRVSMVVTRSNDGGFQRPRLPHHVQEFSFTCHEKK